MAKNRTKQLLIIGALGLGAYLIYRYIQGDRFPHYSSGGGTVMVTPTPVINPIQIYEDKEGKQTPYNPPPPRPGQYQGGPFVTTPDVPPFFAPVVNENIPQLVIKVKEPEIVPSVQPINQVSTSDLKAFAQLNPALKKQAPVNVVTIQPPPLKAFGVDITKQPSITLPQKFVVPVIAGTTKLRTIRDMAGTTVARTSTPVVRVTDVLKGLIRQ